jgi:hypothetical protein
MRTEPLAIISHMQLAADTRKLEVFRTRDGWEKESQQRTKMLLQ